MNYISLIKKIELKKTYTSRSSPTIKCIFHTKSDKFISICPSGKSTGKKEAIFLTDKNINYKNGLDNVIKYAMDELIPQILKAKIGNLREFDKLLRDLDKSEKFENFGGNVVLVLSMCFARMMAKHANLELYEFLKIEYENTGCDIENLNENTKKDTKLDIDTKKLDGNNFFTSPNFNVINGGEHSSNDLPFQEIMINFKNEKYDESLKKATKFYLELKKVIEKKYGKIHLGYGDEGGYMPPILLLEDALDLIKETNLIMKYENLRIAIDSAANSFYENEKYHIFVKKNEKIEKVEYSSEEFYNFYIYILKKYKEIYLLEDPFAEDDISIWKKLTKNSKIFILGDDLVVTNPKIIKKAIKENWCNSILIKPNQIGTITETLDAIKIAHSNNFQCMTSHRSGETEDTFISDLAVGAETMFFKAGAPRGERLNKYNRLLEIYDEKFGFE